MKTKVFVISLSLLFTISTTAFAHSGRTDSSGGHNCSASSKAKGLCSGYHYHNGGNSSNSGGSGSSESKSSSGITTTSPSTNSPTVVPKEQLDNRLKATLPSYKILINGNDINNSYAEYPVLSYKNITYFPMTWSYTQALGIDVNWSADTGFSIRKTDKKASDLTQKAVSYNKPYAEYIIDLPIFNIFLNDSWLDNYKEDYPVIVYKDITYFPMTWSFAVDELGLNINYDSTNGFSITK